MTNEPPEVPDFSEDLKRIAAERVARIRRANRIRAAHKAARLIGVDRRNAAKLARRRTEQ